MIKFEMTKLQNFKKGTQVTMNILGNDDFDDDLLDEADHEILLFKR